jgi:hypothetical protein
MAQTIELFGKALANLLGGEVAGDTFAVDYLSDTIKGMLTTNAYTPNLDTHETKADVTNEVAGTGYVARGTTLGSKTITYTAANSWGTARANTTAYAFGDVVRPAAGNGHLYRCIVAGTSAGAPPTFPTTPQATVTDGGVTWAEVGRGITQIDAADLSWPASTITARYCVIYKDTGSDASSQLLALIDFGADVSTTAGTLTITLPALGLWDSFMMLGA